MNPLAIALALSLLASAGLGTVWLNARDDVATLASEKNAALNAAGMCSKGVDDMRIRAAAAAKAAAPVRAAAVASAAAGEKRADQILARQPSTPADDCKSAGDQVNLWLQGRAKP